MASSLSELGVTATHRARGSMPRPTFRHMPECEYDGLRGIRWSMPHPLEFILRGLGNPAPF